MNNRPAKPFTGRHATMVLVLFFGVIVTVNFTMARYASSTFGGVVVKNSYVASQEFNKWLGKAKDQEALGWTAIPTKRADGRIEVATQNVPDTRSITAIARHPLGRAPDKALEFAPDAHGIMTSTRALPNGRWILRLEINAEGKNWRSETHIQ